MIVSVSHESRALVVGAGVSGLTCALRLRQDGFAVRIVAAQPPAMTTSAITGAFWLPFLCGPRDKVAAWGSRSHARFRELATQPGTGVKLQTARAILREGDEDVAWWRATVGDVRVLAAADVPPGARSAIEFEIPIIDMSVYLPWLVRQLARLGSAIDIAALASLDDVRREADVVVNCSGLGARELAGDRGLVPVRGQLVRVVADPPPSRVLLDKHHPAGVLYVIPRVGDVILGGTAEHGVENTQPDPATTRAILARCRAAEPALEAALILGHQAGLRPYRAAVRLELDATTVAPGAGAPVIHDYGHGGAGVSLSWGCAEEVVALARRVRDRSVAATPSPPRVVPAP